jgi:hypothetical protein
MEANVFAPDGLTIADLSDETLLALADRLNDDLAPIDAQRRDMLALMARERPRLLKPATKLVLNTACAATSIILAPATMGLSLVVTAIGAAVTAWDGVDFAVDIAKAVRARRRVESLSVQTNYISGQLAEIARQQAIRSEQRRRRFDV